MKVSIMNETESERFFSGPFSGDIYMKLEDGRYINLNDAKLMGYDFKPAVSKTKILKGSVIKLEA